MASPLVGPATGIGSTIRHVVHEETYRYQTLTFIAPVGSQPLVAVMYFQQAIVTDGFKCVIDTWDYSQLPLIGRGTTGVGPSGVQTVDMNVTSRRVTARSNGWYDYEEYWLRNGAWTGIQGPYYIPPVTTATAT